MNSRWVKSESILDNNEEDRSYSYEKTHSLPKPGGPLKPRLDAVAKKIKVQIDKVEEICGINRLKANDIFTKLMIAIKDNSIQHSTLLSSELSRTRQVSRVLLVSSLGLEKLVSKLSSTSDFADVVTVLSPAMSIVKNLRSSLTPYIPEMEIELGLISELLSGILVDAGQVGGFTINFETANEQAARIIKEVSDVADQKMEVDFPKLPDIPLIHI
jgi:division protein CdvB (Snf7/Vps24/ESCRT-III family)